MTTPISADEFIASIPGFDSLDAGVQTDLLTLYVVKHSGTSYATAAGLASLRQALHLAEHKRLAPYLSEQTRRSKGSEGRYVKTTKGYALERGYSKKLEASYLGRPTARNLASSLRGTLAAISDPVVKAYLEEAIACFEFGQLRSALIMSWCVAYGLFRAWLFRNHLAALNAEMAKWKTPFTVKTLDDFQELTEGSVIDTARKAGILTKEQTKTLKQLLDQRNSYAHPTLKAITPSVSEAFIDITLREIVPSYG